MGGGVGVRKIGKGTGEVDEQSPSISLTLKIKSNFLLAL